MSAPIRITTAGAGSGKTTELATIMHREIASRRVRPQAIIATTYTVAAAEELGVRVRQKLHKEKLVAEARRFEESLVGTVHSVCQRLIARFAFEAGLSPRVEVLDEAAAEALISQTIERECSAEDVLRMEELARHLSQFDDHDETSFWKGQVKAVISRAVENGVTVDCLPAMAEESSAELLALLPTVTQENLDDLLLNVLASLDTAVDLQADTTQGTAGAQSAARQAARDLQGGHLSWAGWLRLAGLKPGKKSEAAFNVVKAIAARVEEHPRLRDDLREYIRRVFEIASRTLSSYRQRKEGLGQLDFSDLEARAVELLDLPEVRAVICEEYDLLLVDEFQDTSPMQLALFMKLAELVCVQSFWVGDLKQAIYGFRGSDPELMTAVVNHLRNLGGTNPPLDKSYRARPELCHWFNALFVSAFETSHGLPENEVRLNPVRDEDPNLPVPLEIWNVSSGQYNRGDGKPKIPTNVQAANAVAEGIQSMLVSPMQVHDKSSGTLRPVRKRDIAVLCRTNPTAIEIAASLVERGIPVTRESRGLLSTPEAAYALACLKRLVDPDDTLASATIIALSSGASEEEWLCDRLEWLAGTDNNNRRWGLDGPASNPTLVTLENARDDMSAAGPAEALDEALVLGSVLTVVTRWGPGEARAAQRRANIEALRGLAAEYEKLCVSAREPGTVAGFLLWISSLAQDPIAVDANADGVQVRTYHGAKGLEWPVVICAELNKEPRPRLWNQVSVVSAGAFDPLNPLRGRRLRYWPWPFGKSGSDGALAQNATQSSIGKHATRVALHEDLRLLYVGFTRARDQVVLVTRERSEPEWPLKVLSGGFANGLNDVVGAADHERLFLGTRATSKTIVPPEIPTRKDLPADTLNWFSSPLPTSPKPPAFILPSSAQPLAGSRVTSEMVLGARLPVRAACEDIDLGNGLHAGFAAVFHHMGLNVDAFTARIQKVLDAHGLAGCVNAAEVIQAAVNLRTALQDKLQATAFMVEVPFERVMPDCTRVVGFIDLVAVTPVGCIIIDHKSFQGGIGLCRAKALEYTGQILHYHEALSAAGYHVHSQWIHFPVAGLLLQIEN